MIATKPRIVPVPKYRQVEARLREEIAANIWQAGDRLPGEYELASRFSVAYLTMRQAIGNLIDDGILIRVRGKGTFVADTAPASETPTTRSSMVLLFPENWQRIDPNYFPQLWEGFQQSTEESGYRTPCLHYSEAERPGVLEPGSAVACLLLEDAQQLLVERLRDNGHSVLAINHYTGRRSIPCVRIDDASGVEEAVDHLVALGHSRIAFLRGDLGNLDAADRLAGFRQAVRRHDLTDTVEFGDGFEEWRGYVAAHELFQTGYRPTAVVSASDLSTLGLMKAAREKGFELPGDLSVVGFGDFPVGDYITPRLTTVRQSRVELGRTAAQTLIRLANGETVSDCVLQAKLIVRDTTAPVIGRKAI
ncbi:MAG: GntR family transcriptional regulator [Armatimonadetes bacterium]|nr:GntR family transcriptional regulator [Armatimonadota bacterium]